MQHNFPAAPGDHRDVALPGALGRGVHRGKVGAPGDRRQHNLLLGHRQRRAQAPADAAAAKSEQKFSVFSFGPVIGPFFQPGKLPKAEAFLKRVQEDADAVTDTGKNFWKRPRPYVVAPELSRGADDLEKSFSYPSGHSTRGTVLALVLAELFPDKKDQILTVGREIGWHRVELARHYPTDIYAGRVLAGAIVRELKASPEFQKDFTEARDEIATVLLAEKQQEQPITAAAR